MHPLASMHSSRMRTARLLTVCLQGVYMHWWRRGSCTGGGVHALVGKGGACTGGGPSTGGEGCIHLWGGCIYWLGASTGGKGCIHRCGLHALVGVHPLVGGASTCGGCIYWWWGCIHWLGGIHWWEGGTSTGVGASKWGASKGDGCIQGGASGRCIQGVHLRRWHPGVHPQEDASMGRGCLWGCIQRVHPGTQMYRNCYIPLKQQRIIVKLL